MTEELALEQGVRERSTVLGDEFPLVSRARVVDRTGEQILARSGLAGQEYGRVGLGDLLRHVEDLLHGRRVADDPLEGVPRLDLAPQIDVLGAESLVRLGEGVGELGVLVRELVDLEPALDRDAQIVRLPGLGDVAPDAPLVDRGDQRWHVGVAGQHHANGARVALDDAFEEFDAGHAGHDLIRDHEGHVLAVEDLEPPLGGGRRENAVLEAEGELEALEDGVLVVDDQDAVRRRLVSARSCALDLRHGLTLSQVSARSERGPPRAGADHCSTDGADSPRSSSSGSASTETSKGGAGGTARICGRAMPTISSATIRPYRSRTSSRKGSVAFWS